MTAEERIKSIVDEGTFVGFDLVKTDLSDRCGYGDKMRDAVTATGLEEAVVTGICRIGGISAAIGVMDPGFMMGTLSVSVGEAVTELFEYAAGEMPVILFCASGGARIQEGLFALVQMAKVSASVKRFRDSGGLYISCLTDPTMGGVSASFGLAGDINIAEKGARIGFSGKTIVENIYKEKTPEDFQTDLFNEKYGNVDMIVPREEMRDVLKKILGILSVRKNDPSVISGKDPLYGKTSAEDTASKDLKEVLKCVRDIGRLKGADHLGRLFDSYVELKGDRIGGDDASIISGIGLISGRSFVFNIQNKGRSVDEIEECNYGMTKPSGYRKVLRMADLAERLGLPVVNMIDSPGACPSVDSEKNGQAGMISRCLVRFSDLKTPVISVVIGEASSGGALALSVSDSLAMLENSVYTVISPESYLKIMRRDEPVGNELLKKMRIMASDLLEDGIIDCIIEESGDLETDSAGIRDHLISQYDILMKKDTAELIESRYERIRRWDRKVRD